MAAALSGREHELGQLRAVLACAGSGEASALVLRGEPGIGKSALLRAIGYEAAKEGWLVLSTAGQEFGRHLAHRCVAELLSGLGSVDASEASSVVQSVLGPSASEVSPFAFHAAVLSLVSTEARSAPLVLLVDDLQWVDDASALTLAFVLRRLHRDRVATILAMRDGEDCGLDPLGLPSFELLGVDVATGARLLSNGTPVADDVVTTCVERAGGNPLALVELGRLLSRRQLAGEHPLPDPLPVGRMTQAFVGSRLDRLSPSGRRAACLVAAEEGGDVALLRRAMALAGIEPSCLDELETQHLIGVEGGTLDWAHPLFRSGAYHGVTPTERRALHRTLATALAEADLHARSAWHLSRAVAGHDADLGAQLATAAEELDRRGALNHAGEAYEWAARVEPLIETRLELLRRSAECHLRGGRLDETRRVARGGLADATSPEQAIELVALLGEAETWDIGPREGAALLLSHLDQLRPDDAGGVLLRCLASIALLLTGDVRRMTDVVGAAATIPAADLDPITASLRDLVHGHGLVQCGFLREGSELLDASRGFVHDVVELSPRHADTLVYLLAVVDIAEERFDDTETLLRRLISQGRRFGLSTGFADIFLADLLWRAGRWSESHSLLSNVVELSNELGHGTQRMAATALLARADACLGRSESSGALGHEALDYAIATGNGIVSSWAHAALELRALTARRPDEAVAQLEMLRDDARRWGSDLPGVLWWQGDYIEALLDVGREANARDELWILANGPQSSSAWVRATVLVNEVRLGLHPDPNHAFQRACDALAAIPAPFERARALLRWAEHPAAGAHAERARATATRIFESLGAVPWAARARGSDRSSGPAGGSDEDRPRGLPAVLTAAELRVAMAVGAGLGNKEAAQQLYISTKTVEFHLSNVFTKLGVRRRGELIRLVATEQARITSP